MTCYAYDKEAKMCLIYGIECDSNINASCFHTSEQEAIEISNHDKKKKQLMDLIEDLKGKGISANVSAQVAVSFMNGKESK